MEDKMSPQQAPRQPQQQTQPRIRQQSLSPNGPFDMPPPHTFSNGLIAIPQNGNHVSNGTNGVNSTNGITTNGNKRKRESISGMDHSSPHSPGVAEEENPEHEKKRQPGVKRACNECRQQKLRCTVIQEPFTACNRCVRLKLCCKIESNFKRVGKRSKHAEMEKEIERLHQLLQSAKEKGFVSPDEIDSNDSTTRNTSVQSDDMKNSNYISTQLTQLPTVYELGPVKLTTDDARALFVEYFQYYHQFLPLLDATQLPEAYEKQHKLLFWAIIAVAARRWKDPSLLTTLAEPLNKFIWTTIGEVPSSYYVVKALCLLCTWPLPISTSTADPTHLLCGVMMKVATMIGLHRPNNMKDFSRVDLELDTEQLHDRVETWAVCNIVAQEIGTGYGQPASTIYDWALTILDGENSPLKLSTELWQRVLIERFCDKVSKEMYSNSRDPRGVAGDAHRAMLLRIYRRDLVELGSRIKSRNPSPIVKLHLAAARLHLRLAGFYDSSTTPHYLDDLMMLYRATGDFIKGVLETDQVTTPSDSPDRGMLSHCTNYIQQMLVAAGFTLLKLLKSFFVNVIDAKIGKSLFNRTIEAIRHTSVFKNDLQSRLAELMVQMWNGTSDPPQLSPSTDDETPLQLDDSLQLRVRCRHSMSLVFDTIWRWREEFQAKGRGNLDTKSPTHVNTTDNTLDGYKQVCPPTEGLDLMNGIIPSTMDSIPTTHTLLEEMTYTQPLYEAFDPQNWMLDGLMDFQFGYPLNPLDPA